MSLQLSPSDVHYRLLREAEQPLRYAPGQDLAEWSDALAAAVGERLGMPWVEPGQRRPLNIRRLWQRQTDLAVIEKLVFTSEDGADVPAYWAVPRDAEPPYRTMICLQGHTTGMHVSLGVEADDEQTPIELEGDRDYAVQALRHGWAALAIEQRSFGERRENVQELISSHGCHDAAMHALLVGRTLLGERLWDVERGLDLLDELGASDPARIGVMGNSGGGTVAAYAGLLPRITCAMPSCCFGTFRDTIGAIYHCSDNYVPGLPLLADMGDIVGLYAPRPVVIVSGEHDPIFPIESARAEFEHLQQIYDAADAGDRVTHVVGDGGHRFYADVGWPALERLVG